MASACGSPRADEATTTLVVNSYVNHEAVHQFEKSAGHPATYEDLLRLHEVWIDNEILYREGLKQGLGNTDAANRENVISAMRQTLSEQARPASVGDDELRRWFEARRDRYEQPARFDFEDASLPGQTSGSDVRALAEKLNHAPADANVNVRAFTRRPQSNLVQSYGQEAADALAASTPGTWLAIHARDGFRAMRLVSMTPAVRAEFEALREPIRRDWFDATADEKRQVAVKALRKSYKIAFDPTHDCASDK
jgi:hypothetical protein